MKSYRWKFRSVEDSVAVADLARALNDLPEPLARALVLRGVRTFESARKYFRPDSIALHDPFMMLGMREAATRLARAVSDGEAILVYGDYDVDGVTSTALMVSFLRELDARVDFFIPDRNRHGYGLTSAGVDEVMARDPSLVVALDCGIKAVEPSRRLAHARIDLIVCDHHTAADTLPDAVAILDPKQPNCTYPYKNLSGCGVGFKLAQATLVQMNRDADAAMGLVDFVAVSIASDIVAMDGENRVLMREGLEALRERPRLGWRALAAATRVNLRECSTRQIVFGLAPRINAAGRLADAQQAVELLLATDADRARSLAEDLETLNNERREIDRRTLVAAESEARRLLESRDRVSIVLHDPDWHAGVIGITASRLVETFYLPTVMLTTVDGVAKGSARSIEGVNVYEMLEACSDLLLRFGGHDYAAGMQLDIDDVPAFRDRFDQTVRAALQPEYLVPALHIDAAVSLSDIDGRFWAVLKQFEPFGPANSSPVFANDELQVVGRPSLVGKERTHLRFSVRQGNEGSIMPAIGFGMAPLVDVLALSQREGHKIEMAFSIDENRYNGRSSLQLRPRDIRIASKTARRSA